MRPTTASRPGLCLGHRECPLSKIPRLPADTLRMPVSTFEEKSPRVDFFFRQLSFSHRDRALCGEVQDGQLIFQSERNSTLWTMPPAEIFTSAADRQCTLRRHLRLPARCLRKPVSTKVENPQRASLLLQTALFFTDRHTSLRRISEWTARFSLRNTLLPRQQPGVRSFTSDRKKAI